MSEFPDEDEVSLEKLYEASSWVKFDPDMIGINVFLLEYPKNMTGFVVQSGNDSPDSGSRSWFLLFLEKNGTKLAEGCFAPKSKLDSPFLCPIPIPSGHSLNYISVTNSVLQRHTFFEDSVHHEKIETCYLMNDCFGCVLLSMYANFKCKWDAGQCTSSSERIPEYLKDCISIVERVVINSRVLMSFRGVNLNNNFMKICLETTYGECVPASEATENEATFVLDQKNIEQVKQNPAECHIEIDNAWFKVDVRIPLQKKDITIRQIVIIVSLALLTVFLLIFTTYLSCRKPREERLRSVESTEIPTLKGPVGELDVPTSMKSDLILEADGRLGESDKFEPENLKKFKIPERLKYEPSPRKVK